MVAVTAIIMMYVKATYMYYASAAASGLQYTLISRAWDE